MADNKVDITLGDFQGVVNLIDVCTQRGAFRGEELSGVGALRQKFAGAVEAEAQKQQAANASQKPEIEVIDGGAVDKPKASAKRAAKKPATSSESLA